MTPSCPCGSGATYGDCCGRYHAGLAAPSAEALMRSRYVAYALGLGDYLAATWHPRSRPPQPDVAAEAGIWQKLEILHSEAGSENDAEGRVEFKAHWLIGSRRGYLHETSRFLKEDGRWYYLDGQIHP